MSACNDFPRLPPFTLFIIFKSPAEVSSHPQNMVQYGSFAADRAGVDTIPDDNQHKKKLEMDNFITLQ
jgi:hypothetical protein